MLNKKIEKTETEEKKLVKRNLKIIRHVFVINFERNSMFLFGFLLIIFHSYIYTYDVCRHKFFIILWGQSLLLNKNLYSKFVFVHYYWHKIS